MRKKLKKFKDFLKMHMSSDAFKPAFFFIDIETTGLNPQQDVILEVAVVITDKYFNQIDQYSQVLTAYETELFLMDKWCLDTHTKSGLLDAVRLATATPRQIEFKLIELANKHFPNQKVVIAGDSVHFDKSFLHVHMPDFAKLLSHRIIDVSSFGEFFFRTYGERAKVDHETSHRALDDVYDSIEKLDWYSERISMK